MTLGLHSVRSWNCSLALARSDTTESAQKEPLTYRSLSGSSRLARVEPPLPTALRRMVAEKSSNRTGRRRAISATRWPPVDARWANEAEAGPSPPCTASDDLVRWVLHGPAVVEVGRRPPTSWLEVGSMVKSSKNRISVVSDALHSQDNRLIGKTIGGSTTP